MARAASRSVVVGGVVLVVIAAMALDTKAVRIGAPGMAPAGAFVPEAFGKAEFPKVQDAVERRAVDASTLAAALDKDQDEAIKRFGLNTETGPEMFVKFTGVAGREELGVFDVAVPNVPASVHISVQTGPAINGTSLRDGSGLIRFGQFRNQIEYQDAGAALNDAMKASVLAKVDRDDLAGKTVSVVGVFDLSDPDDWVVTPVRFDVR